MYFLPQFIFWYGFIIFCILVMKGLLSYEQSDSNSDAVDFNGKIFIDFFGIKT